MSSEVDNDDVHCL